MPIVYTIFALVSAMLSIYFIKEAFHYSEEEHGGYVYKSFWVELDKLFLSVFMGLVCALLFMHSHFMVGIQ